MEKDNRTITLKFRVNQEEYNLIQEKFKRSNCSSLSRFIRQMILEGVIVRFDDDKMRTIMRNICNISANVNQIAVRVNSTSSIYADDVQEMRFDLDKLWTQVLAILSSNLTNIKTGRIQELKIRS